MGKKSEKGSQFERDTCRLLTRWWLGDPESSDLLFWRSAGSGGMVTRRVKAGKKTRGHSGDVTATDSEGEPLMRFVSIECKAGYSQHTLHDLIDRTPLGRGAAIKEYAKWVFQTRDAALRIGSYYWVIIHRRNNQAPVITFPVRMIKGLVDPSELDKVEPWVHFSGVVRGEGGRRLRVKIVSCRLDSFLSFVTPAAVKRKLARLDKKK